MIQEFPVKNGSRQEVVEYVCFLHNHVNKRLGKPEFDCAKASQYWGGDCGCGANEGDGAHPATE
jgi:hypothetical protein